MALTVQSWPPPWRMVTLLFVHPSGWLWFGCLFVLLLVGPFVEAAAGAVLFLVCYLGGGAFGAAVGLLLHGRTLAGDWPALWATTGLLVAAYGARPLAGRIVGSRRRISLPAFAVPPFVIGIQVLCAFLVGQTTIDAPADLAGAAFGVGIGAIFKLRRSRRVQGLLAPEQPSSTGAPRESALARQAREAATRLETRRATQLFQELVDLEPRRIEHLCGYLNVALLGPDETVLQDAALRLLWLRSKSHSGQLRKTFLLLTQPKVLKVLPIDEHLRLARRLVRLREDAAALKVLDAVLSDSHLRQLYGRQLADCLLGIYTGYMRRRLTSLAETIHSRLTTYFEAHGDLGGLPPATRPPGTVQSSTQRPPNSRLRPRS